MTPAFSNRTINKTTQNQSTAAPAAAKSHDTYEPDEPDNKNRNLVIVTVVSTLFALLSWAILFAVLFSKNDSSVASKEPSSSLEVKADSCQGDRRLLYELNDLCHDARSTNGPVLACSVVGRNALIQGRATVGNPYEYGNSWEVVSVFRPCDPERKEPVVALSVLRCGVMTNIIADKQSVSGVNKSYVISHKNRHYGVAGDTTKNLTTHIDASFFSKEIDGRTEMQLLVVLKHNCWPGATRAQCGSAPIIIKNQKIKFDIDCPVAELPKHERHRRLLAISRRRFLSVTQWLSSLCTVARKIGLWCYSRINAAQLGKTVNILGKSIGLDAILNPCEVRGANIVINFEFEGRKIELRRLELNRVFTLPIPYLSFSFLGILAGAVAKVSLGGSLAGLRVGVQVDACGSAGGRQKCLSDIRAGPVDIISHVFYIGKACGRRRVLSQPDFSFTPTVLPVDPLDFEPSIQSETEVQVQVVDVPSAPKPLRRRLANDTDITCARDDALEVALDHLCHDARSPHQGPALSCDAVAQKVLLVGSTDVGDRLKFGNKFDVTVVLDMCPAGGGDPSAAVSILMNDLPIGVMGDRQTLTGANKRYILLHSSWKSKSVTLKSSIDAAFEYVEGSGEIHLVVTIKDQDLSPIKIYDQIVNVNLAVCKAALRIPVAPGIRERRLQTISQASWFGSICSQAASKGFYCNRKGSGSDLSVSLGKSVPLVGTSLHIEATIFSPCKPPARVEIAFTAGSKRIPLRMITIGKTFVVPIPEFTIPVLNVQASGSATIILQGSLQSLRLELYVDFCAPLGFGEKKKQTACTKQLGLGSIPLIKLDFRLGKPVCT